MANRYIRHGAAFNGDGTSKELATVNGGVGAWNNINVFSGSAPAYGTLPAGTTVFIRSKSESGPDIQVPVTSNVALGSTAATSSSWITWVIDNGTVWPGVDGMITYTNTSQWLDAKSYNRFICRRKSNLAFVTTGAGNCRMQLSSDAVEFVGMLIDFSGQSGNGFARIAPDNYNGGDLIFTNCDLFFYRVDQAAFFSSQTFKLVLNGCKVRVDNTTSGYAIFFAQTICDLNITGCEIYGTGASTGEFTLLKLGMSVQSKVVCVGTTYPALMRIVPVDAVLTIPYMSVSAVLCDGLFGAEYVIRGGYASSRDDGNFPKLYATLPGSTTKWSWKVYCGGASVSYPFRKNFLKQQSGVDAVQTVTLNMLVANSLVSIINMENTYIAASYVDATTGRVVSCSSFDLAAGALSTSSAPWTSTSYGALGFSSGVKHLQVTTPTSVKQGSTITVTFVCSVSPPGPNDIMFVCPDVVLS